MIDYYSRLIMLYPSSYPFVVIGSAFHAAFVAAYSYINKAHAYRLEFDGAKVDEIP